jgi:hypothetical protein
LRDVLCWGGGEEGNVRGLVLVVTAVSVSVHEGTCFSSTKPALLLQCSDPVAGGNCNLIKSYADTACCMHSVLGGGVIS